MVVIVSWSMSCIVLHLWKARFSRFGAIAEVVDLACSRRGVPWAIGADNDAYFMVGGMFLGAICGLACVWLDDIAPWRLTLRLDPVSPIGAHPGADRVFFAGE